MGARWPTSDALGLLGLAVSGGLTLQSISAGYNHSCAVTATGAGYCWGDNTLGELGDGTRANRNGPVAVAGSLLFQQITSGGRWTCALSSAGAAYCWGSTSGTLIYGESGALGDGTAWRTTPVSVAGGIVF